MLKLIDLLTPYVHRVEAEMRHMIPSLNQHRPFFGQIHYHLGWANTAFEAETQRGGKRVRATFCLMAAEAFSGSTESALSAAVAIELLHEFTLIHDDIEDNSDVNGINDGFMSDINDGFNNCIVSSNYQLFFGGIIKWKSISIDAVGVNKVA